MRTTESGVFSSFFQSPEPAEGRPDRFEIGGDPEGLLVLRFRLAEPALEGQHVAIVEVGLDVVRIDANGSGKLLPRFVELLLNGIELSQVKPRVDRRGVQLHLLRPASGRFGIPSPPRERRAEVELRVPISRIV